MRIGEKCDFEQHSYGFATFFNVGGVIFVTVKGMFFRCFFECIVKLYFFGFWSKFGCNLSAKRGPKLVKKTMKIYVDF